MRRVIGTASSRPVLHRLTGSWRSAAGAKLRPAAAAGLALLLATVVGIHAREAAVIGIPDPTQPGSGLQLSLHDGQPADERLQPLPAAEAEALPEARTRALLARVPDLLADGDEQQDFALREASTPPPRSGATIEAPWPPEGAGIAPALPEAEGELRVLRHAPDGEVDLAPHVSISFSQPMVALSDHALAAATVPVRLDPQPAGQWRWLGTRTLLFQPEGRMPMATEYRLTVPAGTRSALGGELAKGELLRFSTPAASLLRREPSGGPHGLEPVILMVFDQAVDPAAVLAHTRMQVGGRSLALLPVEADSLPTDHWLARSRDTLIDGRWVALQPAQPLPKSSRIDVELMAGLPSLEGPRRSSDAARWHFETYAPLRLSSAHCGWQRGRPSQQDCNPDGAWYLEFNNPLDEDAFDPASVQVEPPVAGLAVHAGHASISLTGAFEGRTRYQLRLPAGLRDRFGQTLGEHTLVEFHTGSAEPALLGPGKFLMTLDPMAEPALSVYSRGLSQLAVEVHRVGPDDWSAVQQWLRERHHDHEQRRPMPGTRLSERRLELTVSTDALVESRIALSEFLDEGHGQLLLRARPSPLTEQTRWQEVLVWVQATRIGLVAVHDESRLSAWTTDLRDGEPLQGVEIGLHGHPDRRPSAADGLAHLDLPLSGEHLLLIARRGKDLALLPRDMHWYGSSPWRGRAVTDTLAWQVFDDRGMYRPGEQIRVKGWLRRIEQASRGDVQLLAPQPREVGWVLQDSRGVELASGSTAVSALGGFDLAIELPATPNLGQAQLRLRVEGVVDAGGSEWVHALQIQEFRRPEYEVRASVDPGPYVVGGSARFELAARYFAGGALAAAPVQWDVSTRRTRYVPPGRSDWQFGVWTPWWRSPQTDGANQVLGHSALTDAAGEHRLDARFHAVDPPRPTQVEAQATVTDVNRQAWSASASLLVHPAAHYVGLRTPRSVVPAGRPLNVEALAVDIEGRALPDTELELVISRLDWQRQRGQWQEVDSDAQSCAQRQRGGEPVSCSFQPERGGQYRVRAMLRDGEGRRNESELRFWVPGGEARPARDVELEDLLLVPDRENPMPGESVQVLVQAPFADGEGLMTLSRGGVLEQRRFALQDGSALLELAIDEAMVPGIRLDVAVVGAAARHDDEGQALDAAPRRPAAASGRIDFRIAPIARRLEVSARPRDAVLRPGASTVIEIEVRDAQGQPVPDAELALVVVDEAVLALSDYRNPDPLALFHAARPSRVESHFLHPQVVLAGQEGLSGEQGEGMQLEKAQLVGARAMAVPPPPAPMMADMAYSAESGGPDAGPAIALRSDFSALALFAPEVRSDARGRAEVALQLPDSLTRYRVIAVAVAGARQFGSGESAITARQPLMLRPSPPRFANFGDRFELPIVLQNQTDAAMSVELALRALNVDFPATLQDAAQAGGAGARPAITGRRLTVPAQQRVEVRIPTATREAGRARFQIVASSGGDADAQAFELPVWTPATREAFATYGSLAEASLALQPLQAPTAVWPQFGELSVSVSPTELQALTDALIHLSNYPFQGNEQRASRVLAIAALRDVLAAFDTPGLPPPEQLEASLREDLERLAALQHPGGGWSFWGRSDQEWPWVSIHVAHAFVRAEAIGQPMPVQVRNRALAWLRDIERRLPDWYAADTRRVLRAYALDVRRQMGDVDLAAARALLAEVPRADALSIETIGWLLPTFHAGDDQAGVELLLRQLENRVSETAAAAHFVTAVSDQGAHVLLKSSRRSDGVALDALLQVRPQHDLPEKLVRGLLGHRVQGRWANTQENAFILLALQRYFQIREGVTPDFIARIWLDRGLVGEHPFRGRGSERFAARVPMAELLRGDGDRELLLQKDGAGRMYYRIGLAYAPLSLDLAAADHGFAVERRYVAVDDPDDVRQDADGRWRIRAGARVRVELTMVATSRRLHVALVDPLPAGLEAINPALAISERPPANPAQQAPFWWWSRPWYEHQNLRDERVEAFASLLWEGVHRYDYIARATTPGEFIVPPTHAEEMYHPETFGRSGSDRVVVE